MGHDNGQKPPLAFNPPGGIPILGQPFVIKGWFPTVLLGCNCGAHEAVMVPRGGASQCPACKRVFSIQQMVITGQVQFGIGVAAPEDAGDAVKGSILG